MKVILLWQMKITKVLFERGLETVSFFMNDETITIRVCYL